ncbi:glycosyltransferase family 1 protein [Mesorhizobium sp. M0761]|uniref:glycosyltransferase family 1 protein n=1 Tax=Mesorhizobium sp. M0761 TaxID=2956994 RepID=UPI00333AAC80
MARILMIIEAKIATTYLLEQIMEACRAHGVDHEVKFMTELQVGDFSPNTIPMFVRCADSQASAWAKLLSDAGRPYVYYIDDNFWRIVGDNPLALYYRHPTVRKSLEFMVSHAETVIVNSPELARFVSSFNARVTVLPSFFDFSLIDGPSSVSTDEIRIGFAGSPSRVADLSLISPLIQPILERFPKTVFEFAGVLPWGVKAGARVRFFPHTGDYGAYIKFQTSRNWAIGLAPLIDHEANRSKTDNKYREYGALRIAGIYSNITPYKDVVRDAQTGLLVDNTEKAWLDAISMLVKLPEKRNELIGVAFDDAKKRYTLSTVSQNWADVFIQMDGRRPKNVKKLNLRKVRWEKLWGRFERYRVHFMVNYRDGGCFLITQKIIRKILVRA